MATEQRQILCQAVREDGVWTDMPDDYAVLMARIARDPTAIGILGFSHLDQNREPIQAATIDGVAPTYPSIGAWRYPLARPFFDYVGKSPVNVIPGLAGFVREFVSERTAGADRHLVDKGLAPAPPSSLRLERAKALARAGSPRGGLSGPPAAPPSGLRAGPGGVARCDWRGLPPPGARYVARPRAWA